jgi:hypothetical protein
LFIPIKRPNNTPINTAKNIAVNILYKLIAKCGSITGINILKKFIITVIGEGIIFDSRKKYNPYQIKKINTTA